MGSIPQDRSVIAQRNFTEAVPVVDMLTLSGCRRPEDILEDITIQLAAGTRFQELTLAPNFDVEGDALECLASVIDKIGLPTFVKVSDFVSPECVAALMKALTEHSGSRGVRLTLKCLLYKDDRTVQLASAFEGIKGAVHLQVEAQSYVQLNAVIRALNGNMASLTFNRLSRNCHNYLYRLMQLLVHPIEVVIKEATPSMDHCLQLGSGIHSLTLTGTSYPASWCWQKLSFLQNLTVIAPQKLPCTCYLKSISTLSITGLKDDTLAIPEQLQSLSLADISRDIRLTGNAPLLRKLLLQDCVHAISIECAIDWANVTDIAITAVKYPRHIKWYLMRSLRSLSIDRLTDNFHVHHILAQVALHSQLRALSLRCHEMSCMPQRVQPSVLASVTSLYLDNMFDIPPKWKPRYGARVELNQEEPSSYMRALMLYGVDLKGPFTKTEKYTTMRKHMAMHVKSLMYLLVCLHSSNATVVGEPLLHILLDALAMSFY